MNYFDNSTLEELVEGVRFDTVTNQYCCIICDKKFERGVIYKHDEQFFDAHKSAITHVESEHGGMFNAILGLGKDQTGISEIQKSVLLGHFKGESDRVIAEKLGGKSDSTVRNHRFKLKKRRVEAKIFLALMDLLEKQEALPMEEKLLQFHENIPTKDARTIVSQSEADKIIEKHFSGDQLLSFPKKQKTKLVILQKISSHFEKGRDYSELGVNEILIPIYEDYVQIRRYLVDYAYLTRNADGSGYRLNDQVK